MPDYQIFSKEQDPSGQWVTRVVISSEETVFFFFDTDPTQEEVNNQACKYLFR